MDAQVDESGIFHVVILRSGAVGGKHGIVSATANRLDLGPESPSPCAMKQNLDACFAALADPTRRAVVEHLARGPATVSELAEPHPIALPTFMRHLGVLEACGLVRSEKKGRVRTCFIDPDPMLEVQGWMEWQRVIWERRADQIDQLIMPLDGAIH